MRIGISLSGGGMRAAVFHLGVLERLARGGQLRDLSVISTVSGGSLLTALWWSHLRGRWTDEDAFLSDFLPFARQTFTTRGLQWGYARNLYRLKTLLTLRGPGVLAEVMRRRWGVAGTLGDLPETPRWRINCTCYETGRNFRFERKRCGDYRFGYTVMPDFPIALAAAASAGFPGPIGPLRLSTSGLDWFEWGGDGEVTTPTVPRFGTLHLWDGGVYENLGLEAIFKPGEPHRDTDFLLVSDASALLAESRRRFGGLPWVAKRLLYIPMDQVRALRLRMFYDHLRSRPGTGAVVPIGWEPQRVFRELGHANPPDFVTSGLDAQAAEQAAATRTRLTALAADQFDLIRRHGFETADAALYCASETEFPSVAGD